MSTREPRGGQVVVVVGGGVAGTSAALIAAHAGAGVTLIDGGGGATTLWTGAIDAVPWEQGGAVAAPIALEARALLDALDSVVVPDAPPTVATNAGRLRPARGRDRSLFDASIAASGPVAVVRALRPGWDADALGRAWGGAFLPIDATVLRTSDEETIPDADFASRHDEEARRGWLAGRLRDALGRAGGRWAGVILPPSLGVVRARAADLSNRVGIPCGEAMGAPGGPAGLRFEAARDRALESAGVRCIRARVIRVDPGSPGATAPWLVHLDEGAPVDAHAVVLAAGGLIGGGLEYAPAESTLATALPPSARLPLRSTIAAPLLLGERGRPLLVPSSLFGTAPESIAAPFARDPLLERAGVLVEPGGAAFAPSTPAHDAAQAWLDRGLYAAGEMTADAPRTWLAAMESGCRAGLAAARHAVSAPQARPSDGAIATPL